VGSSHCTRLIYDFDDLDGTSRGKNGIEKASKWMLLILFIFFIVLAIRSIILDGAFEGINSCLSHIGHILLGKHFCWRWDNPNLTFL